MSGSGGKRDKDEEEGSSSSTLEKIGVAAAAGAALVWGFSKFMSSSGENDRKQEPNFRSDRSNATAASPWSRIFQRPDTYKLNFDGSESNQKDTAGAGFIIRKQSTGEPVIAGYSNLNQLYSDMCDILVATAMGLKLGLEMAKKEGIQLSLIQGNRTDVIKWVKGEKPEAKYVRLMEEIKQLMKECGINAYQIQEVDGDKYNKVSSKLAELGRINWWPRQIFRGRNEIPAVVNELIDEDMEASLLC